MQHFDICLKRKRCIIEADVRTLRKSIEKLSEYRECEVVKGKAEYEYKMWYLIIVLVIVLKISKKLHGNIYAKQIFLESVLKVKNDNAFSLK